MASRYEYTSLSAMTTDGKYVVAKWLPITSSQLKNAMVMLRHYSAVRDQEISLVKFLMEYGADPFPWGTREVLAHLGGMP